MEFTEYLGEITGLRKIGNEMFLFMRIDQTMIDNINQDRDNGCYDFWNDEDIFERDSEEEVLETYYDIEKYQGLYFKKFPITKDDFTEIREKYFGKSSQIVKFPFPAKIIRDSINDLLFFILLMKKTIYSFNLLPRENKLTFPASWATKIRICFFVIFFFPI